MFYSIKIFMKKIIWIFLLVSIISVNVNIAFWQQTPSQTTVPNSCSEYDNWRIDQTNGTCPTGYTADGFSNGTTTFNCCNPTPSQTGTPSSTTASSNSVNGITINESCLTNGQCKFNIYEALGIRKSVGTDSSVWPFVQDIVLSATFFIWTVVTIALIVSGLLYIFAAASGKDPSGAKKWITGALIGLVIVACSYFIIRLIQYLAKGV